MITIDIENGTVEVSGSSEEAQEMPTPDKGVEDFCAPMLLLVPVSQEP